MNKKQALGLALSIAAAGMTAASAPAMAGMSDSVHCYGVNKCKGHNDCKSANNACKGMGSCKGQGFVGMSASACDHLGGTVGK